MFGLEIIIAAVFKSIIAAITGVVAIKVSRAHRRASTTGRRGH